MRIEYIFRVGDIVEVKRSVGSWRTRNFAPEHGYPRRGMIVCKEEAWISYDVLWTDGSMSRGIYLKDNNARLLIAV